MGRHGAFHSYSPSPDHRQALRKQEWFLKGQMAENIVERLIDAHGYEILPYGVEKRFPGWLHDPDVCRSSVAYRQIRAAPDFVAKIPTPDGSRKLLVPIEVKFRSRGWVDPASLARYDGLHGATLVLVDPQGIRANLIDLLVSGVPLAPIAELECLRLRPELVEHFDRIVQQVYDWHWQNGDNCSASSAQQAASADPS